MKISNLKVGVRLGAGFGAILLLMIAMTVFAGSRLAIMHADSDLTLNDRYPKIAAVNMISARLGIIAQSMRDTILATDRDDITREIGRIDPARKVIAEQLAYLDKTIASEQGRALYAELKAVRAKYLVSQELIMKRFAEGRTEEAKTILLGELGGQQQAYFAALAKLGAYQTALMQHASKNLDDVYETGMRLIMALTAAAIALGGLIAWGITRSITGPLNDAVRIAQTVAAGDLTSDIAVTSTDETGRLLQALKNMNASLRKIVGEVRSGTDTMATASSEIASGNLDLSSRTEQQASSLEETASSMEELTSTVKQNADNARQANAMALTASEVARKGGAVVAEVVQTMDSISASSHRIVDIIAVIDSIAFQTNILALNAAVEAARAGEQGRGFAVVATEVRTLAQRSAGAAREIKTLIGDSVEKVEVGTRLVAQAGATMSEIVASVKRVTDIMGEITAASQEQTAGIEQINTAIAQMDEVTQQNAALVEEAAAAAESLQDQAAALSQVVGIFKTGVAQAPTGSPVPPVAAGMPARRAPARAVTARTAPVRPLAQPARRETPALGTNRTSPPVRAARAVAVAAGDDWQEF